MITLIWRYALFGVAYAINQDDHSSLFADGFFPKRLSHYADPYSYCCYTCLVAIQQWINKNRLDGQVGYFFEAGHASSHLEFMRDQIKDALERRPLVTGLWRNWTPFVARWIN